ncbi:hypothetical protein Y032_0222g2603 [Ancylostoma ceylanicum]|nr:hypothetical protein Y032_0222g2603 [Ancylostoma ceylanicum]
MSACVRCWPQFCRRVTQFRFLYSHCAPIDKQHRCDALPLLYLDSFELVMYVIGHVRTSASAQPNRPAAMTRRGCELKLNLSGYYHSKLDLPSVHHFRI